MDVSLETYHVIEVACQFGMPTKAHVEKEGNPSIKRKRVSKKMKCPFSLSITDKGGSVAVHPVITHHKHPPLLVEGKFVATPSMLSSEKRSDLERLRASGLNRKELKKLIRDAVRDTYKTDQFLVSLCV